jgi:hypothetical protein
MIDYYSSIIIDNPSKFISNNITPIEQLLYITPIRLSELDKPKFFMLFADYKDNKLTEAKDKFKKAIAYRQKTGVSLKEAFAHIYGKKVGAIKKKIVKKTAKKSVVKKTSKKRLPNSYYDKLYQAKKPGKRKSASGNTYYEYRENRTDSGRLLGIKKITKAQEIKNLSTLGVGALMKKVITILKSKAKDYPNLKMLFDDILNNGLQSGIISELIYYKDTLAFYKKYQDEIIGLLNESIYSSGLNVEDLFGNKWDKSDPFARGTNNQNLLTWFAFEETTRTLDNILH